MPGRLSVNGHWEIRLGGLVFLSRVIGGGWDRRSGVTSPSLGVIPASADRGEARPVEDFWIFDSEQVTVELVSGHLTITQPREIAMYGQMFARLAEIAVYGARARDLISSITPAG